MSGVGSGVCPNPALVSTSIPQGYPWSMLAMVCLLVAPLSDIKSSHPGAVVSLYVDDRSWVTDTAAECLRVAQQWRGWSARLGLNENGDKDQFFQISRAGRRKLIDEGADPRKVTDSPKILGVVLKPATGKKSTGAEIQRLQAAKWTLQRVKCLPVSFAVKVLVAGMSAMSKASYGWVCRLPALKEANSVDWALACSCRAARQIDPSLRKILLGHNCSLVFRSAFDQVMALRRCVLSGLALPAWRSQWARVIRKSMCRLGFTLGPSNWQWQSEAACVSLDVRHRNFPSYKDGFAHALRESWRRRLFALCGNLGLGVTASFVGWFLTVSRVVNQLVVLLSSRVTIFRCCLVPPILLRERLLALKIASVRGVVPLLVTGITFAGPVRATRPPVESPVVSWLLGWVGGLLMR